MTVRLRVTISGEYTPIASHYPSDDPREWAALDQEGLSDDVGAALDAMEDSTVTVEVVDDSLIRQEAE